MTAETLSSVLNWIATEGVVLESARGRLPNLLERLAGEPVGGRWWGHPHSAVFYGLVQKVRASPDILVCRLVDGKVTLIHRSRWAALVRRANHLPIERLARVWEEHGASGRHEIRTLEFPSWVPVDVIEEAEDLSDEAAADLLAMLSSTDTPTARRGHRT